MNIEMQIYKNPDFGSVRTLEIDGRPYFVANDVARALGYKRPADAVTAHCKGSVNRRYLTDGGEQEMKVIPEGDVYRLIVKSQLPSAERFEMWVFDEVLPSIRKHGMYAEDELLDNPDLLIKVAQSLKEEREKNKILKADNQRMKPKEIFADAVAVSHTSILIGDLAKLIAQNGVDIGQKRLFAWMRSNGFLIKRRGSDWNMPTQRSVEMGLFQIKESTVNNPDGTVRITRTTKVTGRGQIYFIQKFLSQRQEE